MEELVFATALCFVRNPAGIVVATAGVDVQAFHPAKVDERLGVYDCPHWDEAGGARVVFHPHRIGKPAFVGAEEMTVFHDGHRRFEVRGLVPRQADMCDATLAQVCEEFRVHGGTYA